MKLYDQIKAIERQYNSYQIDREEAIKQATPLIEQFNKEVAEMAERHGQKPVRLSIKQFAFGRR